MAISVVSKDDDLSTQLVFVLTLNRVVRVHDTNLPWLFGVEKGGKLHIKVRFDSDPFSKQSHVLVEDPTNVCDFVFLYDISVEVFQ